MSSIRAINLHIDGDGVISAGEILGHFFELVPTSGLAQEDVTDETSADRSQPADSKLR
jgi:hypothetical protein